MSTVKSKWQGFTLVELMIVMVLFSLVIAAIVSVVINSQKAKRNTELISDAQQTARVLVDMISEDIRSAGYGANAAAGHFPIVYAAPFDIMISANFAPYPDDPVNHGAPQAIKPAVAPLPGDPEGGEGALYDGGSGFSDGAETIRYTFDSNNDGQITGDDRGDDLEERLTSNNALYSVTRQVYGFNSTTNTNTGTVLPIGLAQSNFPAKEAGAQTPPVFQYWILNSETGQDELWGDADGDGLLSADEVDALYASDDGGVVPSGSLRFITRVGVVITTATRSINSRGEYETVSISTTTAITRNREVKPGKMISGRVGIDGDNNHTLEDGETGVPNIKVTNELDGQITYTDEDGAYTFYVEPRVQTIAIALPTLECSSSIGYKVVDPVKTEVQVDATTESQEANFPLTTYVPGKVSGYVREDVDGDGAESAETGIPGCIVYLKTSGRSITTDGNGYYCLAAEQITLDTIACVPAVHTPEYLPTIPVGGIAAVSLTATPAVQNFGLVAGQTGTIKGKVYNDLNGNGTFDAATEQGIAGVELAIYRGNTTFTEVYIRFESPITTKDDGTFECTVIAHPTERYIVYEIDPAGFFSTTSNRYDVGLVAANAVVNCPYFGDKVLTAVQIKAANVLSMTANVFKEWEGGTFAAQTTYNDTDIVLGTRYGTGNVRGWFNKRYLYDGTQVTDVYQLFESSYTGSRMPYAYSKLTPNNSDIKAIESGRMNELAITKKSGPNYIIDATKMDRRYSKTRNDIVVGVHNNYSGMNFNVAVWPSMDTSKISNYTYSGLTITWDSLGQASDTIYTPFKLRAGGNADYKVNALALADFAGTDGFTDVIAGYSSATSGYGGFQMWVNTQKATYPGAGTYETRLFPDSSSQVWEGGMGEVLSLAAADMIGDTKIDLVAGTKDYSMSLASGTIHVYTGTGVPTSTPKWFNPFVTLNAEGEVMALKAIDFNRDGKKDIIAAVRNGSTEGQVQVWLQDAGGTTFGMWDNVNSKRIPSYVAEITGYEPICLDAAVMKWTAADTFPKVVVGVRNSEITGKALIYDCSGGVLPEIGANLAIESAAYGYGAVASVRIADLDMDGKRDIAVAEKTSDTEGNLVFYYGK